MRSRTARLLFFSSLMIAPVVFGIVSTIGGPAGEGVVSKFLFVMTVVVEIVALAGAVAVRKRFSPSIADTSPGV